MSSQVLPDVCTALPDSRLLSSERQTSVTLRPRIDPQQLSYHLIRPRQIGLADVGVVGEAYRCWSEVWSETLRELDGLTDVPSDEFTRQDEVGAIFHGYECIALSCFRWIDLSIPMYHDDTYFRVWPKDAIAAASQDGSRVCIGSHVTVSQAWRRVRGCSLRHVVTALTIDRAMASGSDAILGTMRDDRGMASLVHGLGATTLGHARLHNVPVTLIAVYRSRARPPLDPQNENIVRTLGASIQRGERP